jgi:Dihydropteroate synthase and related enzymes
MIWKLLNSTPDNALCGTVALNMYAILKGADIIRVHDVKEGVESIKLAEAIIKANNNF